MAATICRWRGGFDVNVREFMTEHFRHFNAATTLEAARAFEAHLAGGGKVMVTLAGAMSTAELGRSLAAMIRADKVHAIASTGANVEEDLFNLVARNSYKRLADWRSLSPEDEVRLLKSGLNRVTDTCIPEEEAFRKVECRLIERWKGADAAGIRKLPHEFLCDAVAEGDFRSSYEADPEHSWLVAAAEKRLPMFVPGWEDSTLGNVFAARVIDKTISTSDVIRSGIEYMVALEKWYSDASASCAAGFFQIGGGIAGDFAISVAPMIRQDLHRPVRHWGYFCQISDSTTSYGSYSGAVPAEKITWDKIAKETPRFMIESDATIVVPLIFAYVLGW
jgi:deoxyhypusine synthase